MRPRQTLLERLSPLASAVCALPQTGSSRGTAEDVFYQLGKSAANCHPTVCPRTALSHDRCPTRTDRHRVLRTTRSQDRASTPEPECHGSLLRKESEFVDYEMRDRASPEILDSDCVSLDIN